MSNRTVAVAVERWNRRGAEADLADAAEIVSQVLDAFPDLHPRAQAHFEPLLETAQRARRAGAALQTTPVNATARSKSRKRRWQMTDDQKAAVSKRMKAYWAKRRREKKHARKAGSKKSASSKRAFSGRAQLHAISDREAALRAHSLPPVIEQPRGRRGASMVGAALPPG